MNISKQMLLLLDDDLLSLVYDRVGHRCKIVMKIFRVGLLTATNLPTNYG